MMSDCSAVDNLRPVTAATHSSGQHVNEHGVVARKVERLTDRDPCFITIGLSLEGTRLDKFGHCG
jgi:hypothetical protein